jgi:hypothetical protein
MARWTAIGEIVREGTMEASGKGFLPIKFVFSKVARLRVSIGAYWGGALMARHPIARDGVRAYLARSSIFRIVFLFVLVVVALAMINALILALLNPADRLIEPDKMLNLSLESVIALLGGDAGERFQAIPNSRLSVAVLTLLSVLLPALLLGAVVYKVLMPRQRLTIFRRQAVLVPETSMFETCFYIATDLDVFDLEMKAYAKFYKPVLSNGEPNPYPLKTIAVPTMVPRSPQPFSLVPTRVSVPVRLLSPQDLSDPTALNLGQSLGVVANANQIEAIVVDGLVIARGGEEFCELLIVLDGKIPQAQSTLLECESYDLFESVKVGSTPTFHAHFESRRQRYRVTNWDAFDPS